jgi:hypothetical protein
MLSDDHGAARPVRRHVPPFGTLVVISSCLLALAACTADAERMVATSVSAPLPFAAAWQHGICLRTVEGGDKWNPLSQAGVVEDSALRQALEKSLAQNQLLGPSGACKYYLDVDILGVSQPSQGLIVTSVQTDSHVNYKIFDGKGRPAFVDTVSASYTEDFSLVPAALRVERASEGAVRTNFDEFLHHLAMKPPAG